MDASANIDPELTVTADIKYNDGNKDEQADRPKDSQLPAISSPVGCSTELAQRRTNKDTDQTPTGSPQKASTSVNKGVVEFSIDGGKITKKIEGNRGPADRTELRLQEEWKKWAV